jgi:hypothetical protein
MSIWARERVSFIAISSLLSYRHPESFFQPFWAGTSITFDCTLTIA